MKLILRILHSAVKSKALALAVTVALVFFCLCMGSYSWFVAEDTVVNKFSQSDIPLKMSIIANEVFLRPENWRAGQQIQKELRIGNNGDYNALIRVSLNEFLALYEIDLTTGLRTVTGLNGRGIAEQSNRQTWVEDYVVPARIVNAQGFYDAMLDQNGQQLYYTINRVFSTAFLSNEDALRNENISRYLKIHWGNVGTTGAWDWIFDPDTKCFYYTKVLLPGQETTELFTALTAVGILPNSYKGGMYKLDVWANGVQPVAGALDFWELTPGSAVYQVLSSLL